MKLIVDMDGVLANLPKGAIKGINQLKPSSKNKFKIENLVDYDFDKSTGLAGITKKIFELPSFFRELEPMPGALLGMASLAEQGHQMLIATVLPSRNGQILFDKLDWLEEHIFPITNLTKKNVVFAYGKEWCMGDIMIDDYPKNLLQFSGERVLVDWPYNREGYGDDEDNGFTRVAPHEEVWHNLNEIIERKEAIRDTHCI